MSTKLRNILIIIAGIITSIIVFGTLIAIGFYFLVNPFKNVAIPYHGAYIMPYFVCIILTVIIIVSYLIIRKRFKLFSKGFTVSLLIILAILIINTIQYINFLNPEPFNEKVWKSNPDKPLEMVYYLLWNDNVIIDKSKSEVINLLGSDYKEIFLRDSMIIYQIDVEDYTYFSVSFDTLQRAKSISFIYY